MLLANHVIEQNLPVEARMLIEGMRDRLDQRGLQMSQQEIRQAVALFQQEQRRQKEQEAAITPREGEQFLARNKTEAGVKTLDSGLQYRVIIPGNGARPTPDSTVTAHYRGTL